MSRSTNRNGKKSRWRKKDNEYRAAQRAARQAKKERAAAHKALMTRDRNADDHSRAI